MRALLQRVSSAQVTVDNAVVGSIQRGLLVFAGIGKTDTESDGDWIIEKIRAVRIFEDEQGKMGKSLSDINGELLIVSQFTLYGNLRKGTRPDFGDSMSVAQAREFYEKWVAKFRQACPLKIEEGRFAAKMAVQLVNDGPVTIMIDSQD